MAKISRNQPDAGSDKDVGASIKEQLSRQLGEKAPAGNAPHTRESFPARKSVWKFSISGLLGVVSKREMFTFCEELSLLLECGMPLIEGLRTIRSRWENPYFAGIIGKIATAVESGHSFSEAVEKHGRCFPSVIVSMMRAGEKGGKLDEMLGRIADEGDRALATRQKAIGIIIYPVVVLAIAVVVVGFIFGQLTKLFEFMEEYGAELPWSMQTLLSLGELFRSGGFWITAAIIVVGIIVGYFLAMRVIVFRLLRDRLLIRLPFVRHFTKQGLLVDFAQVFSSLLHSGVSLPESLEATRQASKNEVLRLTLERVLEAVDRGERITPALERADVFPPLACDLCAIGEETGLLDRVFGRMADTYGQRLRTEIEMVAKLIQPVIIVILALIVGFIIFSFFSMYATMITAIKPA